jgi:hypothetical protein
LEWFYPEPRKIARSREINFRSRPSTIAETGRGTD